MTSRIRADLIRQRARLSRWLHGPHMIAFLPAITLSGFWIGGELALVAIALGIPVLYALGSAPGGGLLDLDRPLPDIIDGATAGDLAQKMLENAADAKLATACVMVFSRL